jgi:tetratricopeptide (TPR) repeat protein
MKRTALVTILLCAFLASTLTLAQGKQARIMKPLQYWIDVGLYHGQLGMYEEAIEAYKQTLRIKPDDAQTYYILGVAYEKLDMHLLAIDAYREAIRIRPDYAEAHNNLGAAYGDLGMHRDGIEAYEQAIWIRPSYAEAHCNLGIAYLRLKDRNAALREYNILKNLDLQSADKLFSLIYKR